VRARKKTCTAADVDGKRHGPPVSNDVDKSDGPRRDRARRGPAVVGIRRRGDRRVHDGHGDAQFRRGRRHAGQHVRNRRRGHRVRPGRRRRRRSACGDRRRRYVFRSAAVVVVVVILLLLRRRRQDEVPGQNQRAQELPETSEDRKEKRSATQLLLLFVVVV